MARRSFRYCVLGATVFVPLAAWIYVRLKADPPVATDSEASTGFRLDPTQPYEISYYSALFPPTKATIVINHTGRVAAQIHRPIEDGSGRYREERSKAFTIPPDVLALIVKAIETEDVMRLHQNYESTDGTDRRSTLVIRQGEKEKRVECGRQEPSNYKEFTQLPWHVTTPHQANVEWQITKTKLP